MLSRMAQEAAWSSGAAATDPPDWGWMPACADTIHVGIIRIDRIDKSSQSYKIFCSVGVSFATPAAQMAELVDALGSGPSGGNTVEVRVLFWAPHLSPDRSRLPQVLHKSLPL